MVNVFYLFHIRGGTDISRLLRFTLVIYTLTDYLALYRIVTTFRDSSFVHGAIPKLWPYVNGTSTKALRVTNLGPRIVVDHAHLAPEEEIEYFRVSRVSQYYA